MIKITASDGKEYKIDEGQTFNIHQPDNSDTIVCYIYTGRVGIESLVAAFINPILVIVVPNNE